MNYLPSKDADVSSWGSNFSTLIAADPARYGMYPAEAATLSSAFSTFEQALQTATDPSTRTSVSITLKEGAKAAFVNLARTLAMIIKANQGVSDEDKVALGLNLPDLVPTPIPRPSTVPLLSVIAATPGEHTIRYADQNTPASRAKPFGVVQLVLFAAVETDSTDDFTKARFVGAFTKQPLAVSYDSVQAGKVATYWGQWNTRTGLLGPLSAPAAFTIAF